MFPIIDAVIQDYLMQHMVFDERWLLQQTLYTGWSRRAIIGMIPFQAGMSVLDVGCGFGAMTFDLAASHEVKITAADMDEQMLGIARTLHGTILAHGGVRQQASIDFVEANAYKLPFEDCAFDFVFSRYLFQHLQHPGKAMGEISRVLKPHGLAYVIDIDDGLSIAFPPYHEEFQTLKNSFDALQKLRGGDRHVGRKLASYMTEAGLEVVSTLIQPAAQFSHAIASDLSNQLTVQKFADLRSSILEHDLLQADEFDRCLHHLEVSDVGMQFTANGQIIAVGRRVE